MIKILENPLNFLALQNYANNVERVSDTYGIKKGIFQMKLQQLVTVLSAPLELKDRDLTPEQGNLTWLSLRVFERVLLCFSISLLFLSFPFGVITWWIPDLGFAILVSVSLMIHLWFIQHIFSFRRLFDIISVRDDASKYAKNHLYGMLIQLGCFFITWLFTFAAWLMAK